MHHAFHQTLDAGVGQAAAHDPRGGDDYRVEGQLGVDGEGFDAQLETFRMAVLAHAESEEREVFPRLRQSLDAEALRSMRTALETAEAMAPSHPHPHGPESAIGNILVGPFVAVVDKVRVALRSRKTS